MLPPLAVLSDWATLPPIPGRLIVYPVMLWMLALGGYVMAAPDAMDR